MNALFKVLLFLCVSGTGLYCHHQANHADFEIEDKCRTEFELAFLSEFGSSRDLVTEFSGRRIAGHLVSEASSKADSGICLVCYEADEDQGDKSVEYVFKRLPEVSSDGGNDPHATGKPPTRAGSLGAGGIDASFNPVTTVKEGTKPTSVNHARKLPVGQLGIDQIELRAAPLKSNFEKSASSVVKSGWTAGAKQAGIDIQQTRSQLVEHFVAGRKQPQWIANKTASQIQQQSSSLPKKFTVVPDASEMSGDDRELSAVTSEMQADALDMSTVTASPVVDERAARHINYGKSLARRGSVFSARDEFTQALRMIAESRDLNSGRRICTDKLAKALRALSEADDFVAADSRQQMEMDIRSIVDSHSTRVINPEIAAGMMPIKAMQSYFNYSSEQMKQAVGQSRVAGEALFCLGKLLTTASHFDDAGKPLDQTKAMVMYQVAIAADPDNHLAANELGVLLAKNGRWQQSLKLFKQSWNTKRSSATLKNLATAYEKCSQQSSNIQEKREQQALAAQAKKQYQTLGPKGTETNAILPSSWTSTREFNEMAAMPEVPNEPEINEAKKLRVAKQPENKGVFSSLKKWF